MNSGDEKPLWTLKPPLQNSSSPLDQEPLEIQKLRKWQEERMTRKLRGEYESATLHLADLINSSLLAPLRIASVRVEGIHKTRPSFLGFLINPILNPITSSGSGDLPQDVQSVLRATRRISDVLQRADIFHSVSARIEHPKDGLAAPEAVDLVFKTREKGRFYLKTSTELGNNEGSASAIGRIRNVFGGAETFEANMSLGTTTRKSFNTSISLPITPDLKTYAEIGAFGLSKDYSSFASCSESLRGVKALVRHGEPLTGSHELAYQAVLRNIGNLTPTASISIREAAGQTSKSSLSYTYTFDNRDDRITGTRGFHTKLFQEFAGLGGDASYFKVETESHVSRPILPGVSIALSACSGLLWSFTPSPSLFPDRFQLGGPLSVRSMRFAGLGPRDASDSLGGDLYWSAGLSVIFNIPRKGHWPIKTHAFLNAGRLDSIDKSRTFAENIQNTISSPSISAGVGLIYKFHPVRMEVNFGLPLVASKSDGTRKGIQVGIGLEFL
ncbi:surface antigen-domain-containing protein [Lentinula aciculospora]|uniref:Surface antigen-domain-containing protein n=1 Tax=Lentinula aciculospora TaxID=153920 RepID=A0A9W9A2J5_9AGAR|nr:surface antigen-domain-containing protein [Lentinula aciculospora]